VLLIVTKFAKRLVSLMGRNAHIMEGSIYACRYAVKSYLEFTSANRPVVYAQSFIWP
jgi:hypothetical protein